MPPAARAMLHGDFGFANNKGSHKMRNFLGHKFWARGYFVTTVGRDEETIRAYIRNQELADQQLDQLELKISAAPKSNKSS